MTDYAIFPILSKNEGKDYLTIDARWEIEDSKAKKMGVWVEKSKAVIITQEEFEKIKRD